MPATLLDCAVIICPFFVMAIITIEFGIAFLTVCKTIKKPFILSSPAGILVMNLHHILTSLKYFRSRKRGMVSLINLVVINKLSYIKLIFQQIRIFISSFLNYIFKEIPYFHYFDTLITSNL